MQQITLSELESKYKKRIPARIKRQIVYISEPIVQRLLQWLLDVYMSDITKLMYYLNRKW